jgi:hypothetical protein
MGEPLRPGLRHMRWAVQSTRSSAPAIMPEDEPANGSRYQLIAVSGVVSALFRPKSAEML